MSDFNTKLDEVASRLYEAGGIDRELNGYNEERVIAAKQAIIDLILSDVIGEDEITYANYEDALFGGKKVTRDKLRAEQRNTMKGDK